MSSKVTISATQEPIDGGVRTPGVLFRSHSSQDPDLQLIFVNAGFPVRRPSEVLVPWGTPEWLSQVRPSYTVVYSLMSPFSRGTVRLVSTNPEAEPIIGYRGRAQLHGSARRARLGRINCHFSAVGPVAHGCPFPP